MKQQKIPAGIAIDAGYIKLRSVKQTKNELKNRQKWRMLEEQDLQSF